MEIPKEGGGVRNLGVPTVVGRFIVDQDKLMMIFGRTIKNRDVISIVRKFLVSGVMIDNE